VQNSIPRTHFSDTYGHYGPHNGARVSGNAWRADFGIEVPKPPSEKHWHPEFIPTGPNHGNYPTSAGHNIEWLHQMWACMSKVQPQGIFLDLDFEFDG